MQSPCSPDCAHPDGMQLRKHCWAQLSSQDSYCIFFIYFFGVPSKCPVKASGFGGAKIAHEKTAHRWNCLRHREGAPETHRWTCFSEPNTWKKGPNLNWPACSTWKRCLQGCCTDALTGRSPGLSAQVEPAPPWPASVNPHHSKRCSSSLPFPSAILQFLLHYASNSIAHRNWWIRCVLEKNGLKICTDYVDKFLFPERLIPGGCPRRRCGQ